MPSNATAAASSPARTRNRPKSRGGTRYFDTANSVDHISRWLDAKRMVPRHLRGTDKFLDVVSWNIRWFDAADPERIAAISEVLAALNADALVLMEIASDGALDQVVHQLGKKKAGFYSSHYGTTGGEQRVVLMWDRDWVRAKDLPRELFGGEVLTVPGEFGTKPQKVFPRLPLHGYFEARSDSPGVEGFTFELCGVHLKAQGPAPQGYSGPEKRWGIPQRTEAAARLAAWLQDAAQHSDNDVIVVGDWNAVAEEKEFEAIRKLEDAGEVAFTKVNGANEATHLVRLNKAGPAGSRIDLQLVTNEAEANAVNGQLGVVIRWNAFEHLDLFDGKARQALFRRLKETYSDHLPVVSRFYLTDSSG